ncbi:PLC-like phosphodiesterase [Pleurostoma richardsiae]|uniref:PLC-like phosphodiesterase n=1 Tax=Pleurostoma richardsiae TaxID=41990 RepID=A0AA38VPY7_9PEZI|nr:PLC-like phosphodiesterase [Pleurostoma richardsiae]
MIPEVSEAAPLLQRNIAAIPPASFTSAYYGSDDRRRGDGRLPQCIAHRGYKAEYPENTMGAFRGAVAVGAHAIETDLHLSRDGVVVISHDATLKRCFGEKTLIKDCDWSYLSTLRTLRAPHESMPRLVDLLEYLAQPGLEDIWVLLDIKRDDDKDELIAKIAEAIASVPALRPWNQRIILGCWTASYVKTCLQHLPGFPLTHIGWSLCYARQFLRVPNVSFNMLQKILVGPRGARFLADARAAGRPVYAWTVDEPEWMEWSIRTGVDGVVTDDPKLFLEVCDRWKGGSPPALLGGAKKTAGAQEQLVQAAQEKKRALRKATGLRRWARLYTEVLVIQVLLAMVTAIFFMKVGSPAKQMRRELQI